MNVDAGNRPDGKGARFSLHFPESLLTRATEQDQNI